MVDWDDTTPLRLKEAAELAFPGGGMTPSGLRREAQRGRLVIERIAGKDYVTLEAIAAMRQLCRVVVHKSAREASRHPDELKMELSRLSLDKALEAISRPTKRTKQK